MSGMGWGTAEENDRMATDTANQAPTEPGWGEFVGGWTLVTVELPAADHLHLVNDHAVTGMTPAEALAAMARRYRIDADPLPVGAVRIAHTRRGEPLLWPGDFEDDTEEATP